MQAGTARLMWGKLAPESVSLQHRFLIIHFIVCEIAGLVDDIVKHAQDETWVK